MRAGAEAGAEAGVEAGAETGAEAGQKQAYGHAALCSKKLACSIKKCLARTENR